MTDPETSGDRHKHKPINTAEDANRSFVRFIHDLSQVHPPRIERPVLSTFEESILFV